MLETIVAYWCVASAVCSVLAAVLPVPAGGGWTNSGAYRAVHALINAVAVNKLNAANAKQPEPRA